jgi:hypothetical protein
MNKKLPIVAFMLFAVSLLAFRTTSRGAEEVKQIGIDSSVQNLNARIKNLEVQVAALQKQINEIALKSPPRVLTIPGANIFPGDQIPRGAVQHEIGGIKYWTIPLKDGK